VRQQLPYYTTTVLHYYLTPSPPPGRPPLLLGLSGRAVGLSASSSSNLAIR